MKRAFFSKYEMKCQIEAETTYFFKLNFSRFSISLSINVSNDFHFVKLILPHCMIQANSDETFHGNCISFKLLKV